MAANQYTHPPLLDQLTEYNVRSLELDVYDDREVRFLPVMIAFIVHHGQDVRALSG